PQWETEMPDPSEIARDWAEIAEKSQRLVSEFLARQKGEDGAVGLSNPMAIGAAFFEMTARLMADPARLVQTQMSLWQDYLKLWQQTTERMLGGGKEVT